MCPTPIGRIHTRVAILFLPAVLGTIFSITTGRADWIVLIGVYLLLGVALDAGIYSWVIRYQPPWMTFVLALFEFGLLYTLAHILDLKLTNFEAVWFYWVSWTLAICSKIVLLPLFSLTYLESAGEFRRIDWSIPELQVPLPIAASAADVAAGAGPLLREASGVHATPPKRLPGPSAVHQVPSEMQAAKPS